MNVNLSLVFSLVLTLFILMAIGFFARKVGVIDDRFSKNLSNFVIKIAQPFMLVRCLINVEFSAELLKKGLFVILFGVAVHSLVALLAHFTVLGFEELDERKILEFSLIFENAGFIGLPVMEAAFGEIGAFYGAFYVVSFNLFMWSYGMILLGRGRSDIRMSVKKMFLNFGTTPCLIGLLLYITRLPLPEFFLNAAAYMAGVCTPLTTIVIGSLLGTLTVKELVGSARIYLFCAGKLLLMPTIIAFAAKLCGLDGMMVCFFAVMVGLPTAANTAMFAEIYDIKPGLAAEAVGMSSVLSVLTIPVMVLVTDLILKICSRL